MKYTIVCDVVDIGDIYTTTSGTLKCKNATLEVVPYSQSFFNMTLAETSQFETMSITVLILAVFAGATVSFFISAFARVTARKE